jgi:hypothetical protein
MAGPPTPRALPTSTWRPDDPALGAAPQDGDFARLLEAASSPGAHRMPVPPEIEGGGPTSPRRRVPYGPPGMVRDHAGDVLPPVAAGARRWAERPLRERIVSALFVLAGLWIVLSVIDAASHSSGDEAGALVVLAVVAFFVLRSWMRSRRRRSDAR